MLKDPETCSWCTDEVEDWTLRELPDGARVCIACVARLRCEAKVGRVSLAERIAQVTGVTA